MCTIVKPSDSPVILKEDLICYKFVKLVAPNIVKSYYFGIISFSIPRYFNTAMTRSFSKPINECYAFSPSEKMAYIDAVCQYDAVEVLEGFHSFLNYNDCSREAHDISEFNVIPIAVCECVIPKGSEVIYGYINNVVSNAIYYKEIINVYNNSTE